MVYIMISITYQADRRIEIEVTLDAYVSISSFSCMKWSTKWEEKGQILFTFPKNHFYVRNPLSYKYSKRTVYLQRKTMTVGMKKLTVTFFS